MGRPKNWLIVTSSEQINNMPNVTLNRNIISLSLPLLGECVLSGPVVEPEGKVVDIAGLLAEVAGEAAEVVVHLRADQDKSNQGLLVPAKHILLTDRLSC